MPPSRSLPAAATVCCVLRVARTTCCVAQWAAATCLHPRAPWYSCLCVQCAGAANVNKATSEAEPSRALTAATVDSCRSQSWTGQSRAGYQGNSAQDKGDTGPRGHLTCALAGASFFYWAASSNDNQSSSRTRARKVNKQIGDNTDNT